MGKLSTLKGNRAAWVGDSALLWITRLVLSELYPNIPLKYLMQRQDTIICNKNLTRYCEENNLKYGCNLFEVYFGQLTLGNIGRAKEIILELTKNNKRLDRLDIEQLENGKLRDSLQKEDEKKIQRQRTFQGIFNKYKSLEKYISGDEIKKEYVTALEKTPELS